MRYAIYQAPFVQTALGFQEGAEYELVYEGSVADSPSGDMEGLLSLIWTGFQRVDPETGPWPPEGFEGRSLSVGDVIVLDGWAPFAVEPLGFAAVDLFRPPQPSGLRRIGEAGQTMIEFAVILAAVVILAALTLPRLQSAFSGSQVQTCRNLSCPEGHANPGKNCGDPPVICSP
jgi:hypothetical protein